MKNERFEEIFLKYKNLIIRIVMDGTGDYQVAQEICQQVFIAFYTNMERVSDDMVKAWLMRCAKNAIVDYYRKIKTKRAIFDETPIQETGNILVEESLEVCETKLAHRELAGRILREIRETNERWYEVLVLHCLDGLSYAETAKKLNISETVLRARLHRARAYIKKEFGSEYTDL